MLSNNELSPATAQITEATTNESKLLYTKRESARLLSLSLRTIENSSPVASLRPDELAEGY